MKPAKEKEYKNNKDYKFKKLIKKDNVIKHYLLYNLFFKVLLFSQNIKTEF